MTDLMIGFLALFVATEAYAHIFRIAMLAQVGFLIYTAFRPSKKKWIALYISGFLTLTAALLLLVLCHFVDSLSLWFFSISAIIYSFILLLCIVFVSAMVRDKEDPPEA